MALPNWTDKGLFTAVKTAAPNISYPKLSPNPSLLSSFRVKDIVLDETFKDPNSQNDPPHDFEFFGGWNGIGTIILEPLNDEAINIDENGEERPPIDFAIPLYPNIKHYPLKNEIVWVIQLADADSGANTTQTTNYYLPPINIWNSQLHNAVPFNPTIGPPNPTFNDYKSIENGSSGGVRRIADEGTNIDLGLTFNENNIVNIHPLLPYEGDIIYEGRFGNSLRFGSTVKKNTNTWSTEGSGSAPITILRNGQSYTQKGVDGSTDPWVPCVENINEDQSSIYLTSTQQVPLNLTSDILTSYAETKIKESPVSPTQFAGNQILLNSGRLVFHAKNDHILLNADKSIHLSARSSINIDTGDQIVLSTDNAKSRITLLSDKIYLGSPEGSSEGDVQTELQSLVLGEDLILVLETIYQMIFTIQGALRNSNIETELGRVSDASNVTGAGSLKTLLENMKKLIGSPSSSPLLSKTTKTSR